MHESRSDSPYLMHSTQSKILHDEFKKLCIYEKVIYILAESLITFPEITVDFGSISNE